MTVLPYPVYRAANVQWLDRVPSGWEVLRLKDVSSVTPSNVDKKSYDGQVAVRLCNYTDVYYNEEITSGLDFMTATASVEEIRKYGLRAGQVIITKDSETADDIGIAAYVPVDLPGVVCGYHLSVLETNGNAEARFLKRLFDSTYVKSMLATRANGLTRVGLGQSALSTLPLPLPPMAEQRQIADYLDAHTAKIDTLIDKQERLIETLAERRQAVISHAVTKGLDLNAPMKDSGYERVGLIPDHWKSAPFIRLTSGRVDYRGATPRKTTEGVQLITARNVKKGYIDREASREYVSIDDYAEVMRRGLPEIGDVLLTMEAPLGNVALVDDVGVAFAQRVIKFRLDREKLLPEFANYLLNGFHFQQQILSKATGSTALGLKASKLIELFVAVPPLAEQGSVVKMLDGATAQIDALAGKAREMIDVLKERRQALISAAVTGKIDVRGLA